MPTQNRTTLKGYFTKGSIPTENNFADLIDSTLIQIDDGLLTSATAPLSIKAVGADEGLINFYRVESGQKPNTTTWQIKHLPVGSSTPGLSIGTPAATLLFIDNTTGNVGIGTQTPGFPLTIGNNTLGDKISLSGQSGNHYGFGIQSAQLQIHTDVAGADVVFGYGNSGSMTETMRIKGNGNVGIGTASPSAKLHIQASDNDALKITNPNFSKTARMGVDTTGVFIEPSENNSSLRLNANPSLIGLFVNGNGNVGIGTTGPNTKLTVWTPSAAGVQEGIRINNPVGFAGNGNGSSLVFSQDRSPSENNINATIQGVQEGADTSERAYLAFGTRSGVGPASTVSEKMRISSAGNVGIGTTNPTSKLTVAGSIAGGETTTGWVLGRGGWGPDNWLRITTSQNGGTYHDLAVNSFYAAGASRYDLAEVTPVRAEDKLEKGEVVVIDRNCGLGVTRSTKPRDTSVYGIVSSYEQAAMIIGGGGPEVVANASDKLPIALVGRVKAKACDESGPIGVGDLLTTSSKPGHMMKCDDPSKCIGAIVAKALEPLANGVGNIMVLVLR